MFTSRIDAADPALRSSFSVWVYVQPPSYIRAPKPAELTQRARALLHSSGLSRSHTLVHTHCTTHTARHSTHSCARTHGRRCAAAARMGLPAGTHLRGTAHACPRSSTYLRRLAASSRALHLCANIRGFVRPSSLGTISWLGSLCSSNLCRRCGNCARGGAICASGAVSTNSPGLIGTDQMCRGCDLPVGVRLRSARWPLVRVGHWICRSVPVAHEIRDWRRLPLALHQ